MENFWLHRCSPACRATHDDGGATPARRGRVIDIHCHMLSPGAEALVAGRPEKQAEPALALQTMGEASISHNAAVMLPYAGPRLTRLDMRLADMDAMGVDVQAVSVSPTQYYYWADAALAEAIVGRINEDITALCATAPSRLVGLATVALQFPEMAAAQLRHAMQQQGLRGVEIAATAGGMEFSDPRFDPFWQEAESLGALVFLHPWGNAFGSRLNRFYLANIIGQPCETTIALSHLIYGGVLDRFPKLRICAAHGGGFLPFYPGRSDHAWAVRPDSHAMAEPPSAYLRRIWYDTVVHDPAMLRALASRVGHGQLVLGTDYPFDMGDMRCASLLREAGFDSVQSADIMGATAARLLGLEYVAKAIG